MEKILNRERTRAFSLIEVLIAMLILFYIILSLTALFSHSLMAVYNAKMRTKAVNLAQEKYDFLVSIGRIDYTDFVRYQQQGETLVDNGTDAITLTVPFDSLPDEMKNFQRVTTITDNFGGLSNIVHVEIVVTWKTINKGQHQISTASFIQETH